MHIGQRIVETRRNLAMSQRELASAVGVSAQHISAIENNKRAVSLDLLVKLANELGTTTDYILTGKQDMCDAIAAVKADKKLELKVKKALVLLMEELSHSNKKVD